MEHGASNGRPKGRTVLFSILTILAIQSILQTVWYYAGGRLNLTTDILSTAVAILAVIPLLAKEGIKGRYVVGGIPPLAPPSLGGETTRTNGAVLIFTVALLLTTSVLYSAWSHATTDAIRTPWSLMPHGTFLAIALLGILGWIAAWKMHSAILSTCFSILTLASIVFIAPFIYKTGFGFDGFLHRASEQVILTTGTLNPYPPSYIGQYVFVTSLARITHYALRITTLRSIDLFLVPIFTLLLPFAVFLAFPNVKRRLYTLAALASFLPLSAFVATTPQSFAYLLGLLALIFSFAARTKNIHPILPLALAAWSLAAHPLAGIVFFFATLLMLWITREERFGRSPFHSPVSWLLVAGATVGVPTAFLFNNFRGGYSATLWNVSQLWHGLALPVNHLALWADWAQWIGFLFPLALVASALYASFHNREHRSHWLFLVLTALGVALAGLFLRLTGNFSFLIDYERTNYADRLFLMTQLLLLLPALDGVSAWFERASSHLSKTSLIFLLLFFGAWQSGQAYLALPRHDATITGHGWSVGRADQKTVRWIDQDARGERYTVLANQSVSAAAVEAFGFARYAKLAAHSSQLTAVFYYPIPTGGPLYQLYLQMTDEPNREIIKQAAQLGQSSLVYVVLNEYWWDAERVAEKLSALADQSQLIENGKTRVYKFDVMSDKKR